MCAAWLHCLTATPSLLLPHCHCLTATFAGSTGHGGCLRRQHRFEHGLAPYAAPAPPAPSKAGSALCPERGPGQRQAGSIQAGEAPACGSFSCRRCSRLCALQPVAVIRLQRRRSCARQAGVWPRASACYSGSSGSSSSSSRPQHWCHQRQGVCVMLPGPPPAQAHLWHQATQAEAGSCCFCSRG